MVGLTKLFKRLKGGPAESPLWDHLDACGIPFRDSKSTLIEQFGSYPTGWSQTLDLCEPKVGAPFIPCLAKPLNFKFHDETDLSTPPGAFIGSVQQSRDHAINYARAVHALVKLFGEGEVTSASNTAQRTWEFGLARLTCTVWPPEQQEHLGRNTRHDMFPETETEAALTIEPAWRPALSETGLRLCQQAQPIEIESQSPRMEPSALTRDWPSALPHPGKGLAYVSGEAILRIWDGPYFDGLAQDWISALVLERITAGRTAASCRLALSYRSLGSPNNPLRSLEIGHASSEHAFHHSAPLLARQLGVELEVRDVQGD